MKLPHVTVEFREEESFALGKVSWPLIIGFAVHWAWTYILFAGPGLVGLDMPGHVRSIGLVVSMSALSVTLFCYGIFLKQMRSLFGGPAQRRKIRLCGAVCVCIGTALIWPTALAGEAGLPLGVVSGLASGVGSAVLLMSYGVSFSVFDVATAAFSTALSLLFSPFIYLFAIAVLQASLPAGALVCLAMPFVELLCLNRSSVQLVDNLEFNSLTIPVKAAPFALHVFLPGLVFGFIIGIVRTIVFVGVPMRSEMGAYGLAFALAAIATCALIIAAMLTQRQTNNFMFRTLLPVASLLIASLYFIGAGDPFYATFALVTSYLMLEACIWVFLSDVSQRFRISAFTVFGFGRGSFTVGSIVSYVFMLGQPGEQLIGQSDFGALVAAAFVAFIFGYSFLPKNAELRDTLKPNARCLALWNADDVPAYGLSAEDAAALAEATEPDAPAPAGKAAGSQAARGGEGAGGGAQEASAPEPAPAPASKNAAAAPATASKTTSRTAVATARGAQPAAERMEAIDEVEGRVEASEEEKRQHLGRFKRKCALVADTYLLSRKETEVLFLLAKGKNSAAIQEQLYISAGTANTHMRRIYRKLDVHSQQELIKLVESVDVSDRQD